MKTTFGTFCTGFMLSVICFCSVCAFLPSESLDRNESDSNESSTNAFDRVLSSYSSTKPDQDNDLFSDQYDSVIPFWKSPLAPRSDKNDVTDLGHTNPVTPFPSVSRNLSDSILRTNDKAYLSSSPPRASLFEFNRVRYKNERSEMNQHKSETDSIPIEIMFRNEIMKMIYLKNIFHRFFEINKSGKKAQSSPLVNVSGNDVEKYRMSLKNRTDYISNSLPINRDFEPLATKKRKGELHYPRKSILYRAHNKDLNRYFPRVMAITNHVVKPYRRFSIGAMQNPQRIVHRKKRFVGSTSELKISIKRFFPEKTLLKTDRVIFSKLEASEKNSEITVVKLDTNLLPVINATSIADTTPGSQSSNNNAMTDDISKTELVSVLSSLMLVLVSVVLLAAYWVRRRWRLKHNPELQRLIDVRSNAGIHYNQSGLCF